MERHRREAATAATRADSLEEELESTKQRTAKQLTDMALHLANLTDDIHALRRSGSTASGASKVRSRSHLIVASLVYLRPNLLSLPKKSSQVGLSVILRYSGMSQSINSMNKYSLLLDHFVS